MKFHLLPVGEKFEYQGEVYIKADKLIANCENSGKNRLIPRSANVQPVNTQANSTPKVVEEHHIQTAKVLAEFDVYHQRCLQYLSEIASYAGTDVVQHQKEQLETARKKFIDSLIE